MVAISQHADLMLIHDTRTAALFYSLSLLEKVDSKVISGVSRRNAPVPLYLEHSGRYAIAGDGGSLNDL